MVICCLGLGVVVIIGLRVTGDNIVGPTYVLGLYGVVVGGSTWGATRGATIKYARCNFASIFSYGLGRDL